MPVFIKKYYQMEMINQWGFNFVGLGEKPQDQQVGVKLVNSIDNV